MRISGERPFVKSASKAQVNFENAKKTILEECERVRVRERHAEVSEIV